MKSAGIITVLSREMPSVTDIGTKIVYCSQMPLCVRCNFAAGIDVSAYIIVVSACRRKVSPLHTRLLIRFAAESPRVGIMNHYTINAHAPIAECTYCIYAT